eukprot:9416631-Heterocapsa_arctica.AAC.1
MVRRSKLRPRRCLRSGQAPARRRDVERHFEGPHRALAAQNPAGARIFLAVPAPAGMGQTTSINIALRRPKPCVSQPGLVFCSPSEG